MKSYDQPTQHIKKQKLYFADKIHLVKAMIFPVVMCWYHSWTINKAKHQSIHWCFWTVVLEKTLESPLDGKEIQPVYPEGNQSWIFIGRTDAEGETPILWPPDVNEDLTHLKDPDAGKDWRWEKKGLTKDEMAGWHHWLSGHEFE